MKVNQARIGREIVAMKLRLAWNLRRLNWRLKWRVMRMAEQKRMTSGGTRSVKAAIPHIIPTDRPIVIEKEAQIRLVMERSLKEAIEREAALKDPKVKGKMDQQEDSS
ncbi:hypothetical protein QYF36_006396 [Acer negundo]|nr:hypothetical protein QYF36_006396 [Acer negundo]